MHRPRIWLFGCGAIGPIILGPVHRLMQMAKFAQKNNFDPIIALDNGSDCVHDGVVVRKIHENIFSEIQRSDRIVIAPTLHPKVIYKILKTNHPFDVDFYGVGAFEHLEMSHTRYSTRQIFQSRRRLSIRYEILTQCASKIYLSTQSQLTFLGGIFYAQGNRASCNLASQLPEKSIFIPMGCSEPLSTRKDHYPFPSEFYGHPVFLWGGGIWSWFDIRPLIKSFSILNQQGIDARLYFVCSKNPTGIPSHDRPIQDAINYANDLGLLDKVVAFGAAGVDASTLHSYLEHCEAGVMSNPSRLESIGSWRTRLLDLPAYSKPIFTLGYDPLSHQLSKAGAAMVSKVGDAYGFAENIRVYLEDHRIRTKMRNNSRAFFERRSSDSNLLPWVEHLTSTEAEKRPASPSPYLLMRYALGW